MNTETNEAVAIKILDKDKIQSRNMGAQIKKEIAIMKMINHHHVVSVKDVFATSAKIFIVLEFVGGGELFDKIANEGRLSEDKARFYFKQLAEGLEHCHDRGICHRDLKPENLLLDTDGNLKISDFGFSTLSIGDPDGDGGARAELLHTTCGTPNYVAPEVLGKDGYDGKKADVWSVGVILYVLLAGYLPFDENTMAALFQKIKNAEYEFPDWFSPDARDLISKILVPDPHKRPKLSELKNHPWMLKGDSGPTAMAPVNHNQIHGAPANVIVPGSSHTSPAQTPQPVHVPSPVQTQSVAATTSPIVQPVPASPASTKPTAAAREQDGNHGATRNGHVTVQEPPAVEPKAVAPPRAVEMTSSSPAPTTASQNNTPPPPPPSTDVSDVQSGGGFCCFGGSKKNVDKKQYNRV